RGTLITKPQRRRMEAAYGMVFPDAVAGPRVARIVPDFDERKAVAVRPGKMKSVLTECAIRLQPFGAGLDQPVLPEFERAFGHRKQCRAHLAGAGAAACDMREWKIGHHRAGRAGFV